MGRRSGSRKLAFCGGSPSSSSSSSSSSRRSRTARRLLSLASPSPSPSPAPHWAAHPQPSPPLSGAGAMSSSKLGKKKQAGGARLWMRLDRWGASEVVELDRASVVRRAGVPPRDLRVLGPVFSRASSILAREKAMVISLESIRAIVTAEEVLLLDPLAHEVLPFVDQLRQRLRLPPRTTQHGEEPPPPQDGSPTAGPAGRDPDEAAGAAEERELELPFEFQVLELALEAVCSSMGASVAGVERRATPALDELTTNASTRNLERVRSLKTDLTRLLARVQKVRDEIQHLLDDTEDMAHLYLTRKQALQQNSSSNSIVTARSSSIVAARSSLPRLNSSFRSTVTSMRLDSDVEDLEMLLEAYFKQLDGIRNRILSVREYIDDTEDYVNIRLDNQRNELIQLQLALTIAAFGIALNTFIVGDMAMNIPCSLYATDGAYFVPFVVGTSGGCALLTAVCFAYAWWKKLLGS